MLKVAQNMNIKKSIRKKWGQLITDCFQRLPDYEQILVKLYFNLRERDYQVIGTKYEIQTTKRNKYKLIIIETPDGKVVFNLGNKWTQQTPAGLIEYLANERKKNISL